MIRQSLNAVLLSCVCAAGVAAQSTPPPQTTPQTRPQMTPQMGQPIVLSGCVGNYTPTGRPAGTMAAGAPRYQLGHVEWGTHGNAYDAWAKANAGSAGAPPTTRPMDLALMTARDSKVDLSKYMNQNIEVTGTLATLPSAGGTTPTPASPMFNVTEVKVLSEKCNIAGLR